MREITPRRWRVGDIVMAHPKLCRQPGDTPLSMDKLYVVSYTETDQIKSEYGEAARCTRTAGLQELNTKQPYGYDGTVRVIQDIDRPNRLVFKYHDWDFLKIRYKTVDDKHNECFLHSWEHYVEIAMLSQAKKWARQHFSIWNWRYWICLCLPREAALRFYRLYMDED